MGRITVFTAPDCRDCSRVRRELQRRDMPFEEIDLSVCPDRRKDMISLTDSMSTPQVFFNERHIGSAEETLRLLSDWDVEAMYSGYDTALDRMEIEVLRMEDPSEERLRLPERESRGEYDSSGRGGEEREGGSEHSWFDDVGRSERQRAPRSRGKAAEEDGGPEGAAGDEGGGESAAAAAEEAGGEEEDEEDILLPSSEAAPLLAVTRALVNATPRSTRYTRGSKSRLFVPHRHRHTTAEADMLAAIMYLFDIPTTDEAEAFCRKLQSRQVVHRLGDIKEGTEDLRNDLYRLQPFNEPKVLNSFRTYEPFDAAGKPTVPDPVRLSHGLLKLVEVIIAGATDEVSGEVNFEFIRWGAPFSAFEGAACKFRAVDMSDMEASARKAYAINVYNIMARHALIKWGVPRIASKFFDKVRYNLGGIELSLNDIRNVILRGGADDRRGRKLASKQRSKLALPSSSSGKDKDRELKVKWLTLPLDPLVHFALSSGAQSDPGPEVFVYTPHAIDEELRVTAQTFLGDEKKGMMVDKDKVELTFPAVIGRYWSDFASSKSELPGFVLKYMTGDKAKDLQEMIDATDSDVKIKFRKSDWSTICAGTSVRVVDSADKPKSRRRLPSRMASSVRSLVPKKALTKRSSMPLCPMVAEGIDARPLLSQQPITQSLTAGSIGGKEEDASTTSPNDMEVPGLEKTLSKSMDQSDAAETLITKNFDTVGEKTAPPSPDPKPFDAQDAMKKFVAAFSDSKQFAYSMKQAEGMAQERSRSEMTGKSRRKLKYKKVLSSYSSRPSNSSIDDLHLPTFGSESEEHIGVDESLGGLTLDSEHLLNILSKSSGGSVSFAQETQATRESEEHIGVDESLGGLTLDSEHLLNILSKSSGCSGSFAQETQATRSVSESDTSPSSGNGESGPFFSSVPLSDSAFRAENNDGMFDRLCLGAGITMPSKVQALSWPVLLRGETAVVAAEAGSGKTFAYLLPILQRSVSYKEDEAGSVVSSIKGSVSSGPSTKSNVTSSGPKVLILASTVELAIEIGGICERLSQFVPFRSVVMKNTDDIGFRNQIREMHTHPVDIIVTTPSRLCTVLGQSSRGLDFDMTSLQSIVMDNADAIFEDEDFQSQLRAIGIAAALGDHAQFVLVTSALSRNVMNIVERDFPNAITVKGPGLHHVPCAILQRLVDVSVVKPTWSDFDWGKELRPEAKMDYLISCLRQFRCKRTVVFCNSPESCEIVASLLMESQLAKEGFFTVWECHEAMPEEERQHNVSSFSERRKHEAFSIVRPRRSSIRSNLAGSLDRSSNASVPTQLSPDRNATNSVDSSDQHSVDVAPPMVQSSPTSVLTHNLINSDSKDKILVCTDAAVRGLDFGGTAVEHAVNFDFPMNAAEYLRNSGHTGRGGRAGTVTSLAHGWQVQVAKKVIKGKDVEKFILSSSWEAEDEVHKDGTVFGMSAKSVEGSSVTFKQLKV